MRFFGKTLKHILRSLFSIIAFLLFIGSAKMNRDMRAYVSFLNSHDRSQLHRSQPGGWTNAFWPNIQLSGNISDMLDPIDITADTASSGFDVYDPATEEDFNSIIDSSSGTTEEDFGFTTDQGSSSANAIQTTGNVTTSSGTTSKTELLNAIKQKELNK